MRSGNEGNEVDKRELRVQPVCRGRSRGYFVIPGREEREGVETREGRGSWEEGELRSSRIGGRLSSAGGGVSSASRPESTRTGYNTGGVSL